MSKTHELNYLTRFLTSITLSSLHTTTDTPLLILPSPANPLNYCFFPLFMLQVKDCFILLFVFAFAKHVTPLLGKQPQPRLHSQIASKCILHRLLD